MCRIPFVEFIRLSGNREIRSSWQYTEGAMPNDANRNFREVAFDVVLARQSRLVNMVSG
jgi:hypothetical protein